jgi:hypothetical protein
MFKFQWPWYIGTIHICTVRNAAGISNRSTNNPIVRSKLNPWEFSFYDVLRYTRILLSNIAKSKLNICSSIPKVHVIWKWNRDDRAVCLFFFHAESSSVTNNFVFTVPYLPLAFVSGILFLYNFPQRKRDSRPLIWLTSVIRMLPVVTIRDENCSKTCWWD